MVERYVFSNWTGSAFGAYRQIINIEWSDDIIVFRTGYYFIILRNAYCMVNKHQNLYHLLLNTLYSHFAAPSCKLKIQDRAQFWKLLGNSEPQPIFTLFIHLPDTFQKLTRHLPDTVKIPFNIPASSKHIPNILQIPTPIIEGTSSEFLVRLCGGWVGGITLIILAFQDPTCNRQDFKQKLNPRLGPSVAKRMVKIAVH